MAASGTNGESEALRDQEPTVTDPGIQGEAVAASEKKGKNETLRDQEPTVNDPGIHGEAEALAIANKGGWEIDALIDQMEKERLAQNAKQGIFDLNFKNPKHFTWLLVGFASMGGLLSGLDQSLISGANLYMPKDLGLTVQQNSLVNSGSYSWLSFSL
jgi:hypothetical protein